MSETFDERTAWWCEKCHASGIVEYPKGESVYSVIYLLERAHDDHELATDVACIFGVKSVRVTRAAAK